MKDWKKISGGYEGKKEVLKIIPYTKSGYYLVVDKIKGKFSSRILKGSMSKTKKSVISKAKTYMRTH